MSHCILRYWPPFIFSTIERERISFKDTVIPQTSIDNSILLILHHLSTQSFLLFFYTLWHCSCRDFFFPVFFIILVTIRSDYILFRWHPVLRQCTRPPKLRSCHSFISMAWLTPSENILKSHAQATLIFRTADVLSSNFGSLCVAIHGRIRKIWSDERNFMKE